MKIDPELITFLENMLYELETNKLVVENTDPDPEHPRYDEIIQRGGKVLAAVSKNPSWYSDLCKLYPRTKIDKWNRKTTHSKKPRTRLKRANVLKVLRWMIKNKKSASEYTEFLIDVAQSHKEAINNLMEVNKRLESVIAEEEVPY